MKTFKSKLKHPKATKNFQRVMESDEEGEGKATLYNISQMQQSYNSFIVRLHSSIASPSEYSNLFNLFDNAGEGDHILLDICSPGGALDTAILIRRAIQSCDAVVTCRIGPTCSSAAGAIALAADNFEVGYDSNMMVHTASLGYGYGKVHDLHAHSEHNMKQISRFVREVYEGFLTEEEIEDVLRGRELFLDSDELSERLHLLMELRNEEGDEEDEGHYDDDEDDGIRESCDEDEPDALKSLSEEELRYIHSVLDKP